MSKKLKFTAPHSNQSNDRSTFSSNEDVRRNSQSGSSSLKMMQNEAITQKRVSGSLSKIIASDSESSFTERINESVERIFTIDQKNGKLIENNVLTRWMRDLKKYWISYQNIEEVSGLSVTVLEKNSGERLNLLIDYNVQIIHGEGSKAVELLCKGSRPVDKLNDELSQWVKTFCSGKSNLIDDFFQIEDDLKAHVRDKGKRYGLVVNAFIQPESDLQTIGNYSLVDHVVLCSIKNYELEVKVNLALTMVNKRLFRKMNVQDVDKYVRKKTEQIIQDELLSISYAQLIRNFHANSIEGRIKDNIDRFTHEIGFSVSQLIAIPQLKIFKWLEGFQFVTNDDENGKLFSKIEYATKDSRINVKLSIAVSGRIDNFDGKFMENHLVPDIDLELKMKEAVIEQCRKFLHNIEPQEFHFQFSMIDDSGGSFESRLEQLIRNKLENEYNAVELSIIIKPVDTEITERFKRLQQGSHKVEVKNFSEEIRFDLWYKIIAVHPLGWTRFQSNAYTTAQQEIEAISERITISVEEVLDGRIPISFFQVKNERFYTLIDRLINGADFDWLQNNPTDGPNCARKVIIHEFGLMIELAGKKRHQTSGEKQYLEDQKAKLSHAETKRLYDKQIATSLFKNNREQLDRLLEDRKYADPEEVHEIDEAIKDFVESNLGDSFNTDQVIDQLENGADAVGRLGLDFTDNSRKIENQDPPKEDNSTKIKWSNAEEVDPINEETEKSEKSERIKWEKKIRWNKDNNNQ